MTIDAHVHVWDIDRAEYPWLTPEIGSLYRTITFDEVAPQLREFGIRGAVLVQASDEAADTRVMLDAAIEHPEVLGVVAWSPLDDPARLAVDLESFVREPKVVGIRNLVHEHPREWLLRPEVDDGLGVLASSRLPLDFPTANHHALADVARIGERHPDLAMIIDHLGKPPIGGSAADRAQWRELIAGCAQNPRTVAKVSGLYASQGPLDLWTVDQVRPFVDDAIELFGPDRLLYGGDWPISLLAGGYERTWSAITAILESCDADARSAIMEGTARRVYALDARD
jgi:L-fuconolactonase